MSRFRGQRVAVYARYSSANQREASIDDQVRRCREYIEQNGGVLALDLVFTDSAVSGASLQRPGFEQLMRVVEAKCVDVVVTESVDRVSRDLADSAALFKRLEYMAVALIGVSDGVDTSRVGEKLNFAFRALQGEMYLEQLSSKTKRGQEGRWLQNQSTGGLSIGFTSEPVLDAFGKVIGKRIVIDPPRADVVRRIFALYLAGRSHAGIAKLFNAERIEPARRGRYRKKGWVSSSVRAILMNPAYRGEFTWRKREWRKVPGTNRRMPRERAQGEVMTSLRPELAIVDAETWEAVQARLKAVRDTYVKGSRGQSGKQTTYPLSGILTCGLCGAPMTIHKGSHSAYYKCSAYRSRGTCSNGLSQREDVARERILAAISHRFSSPRALDYLTKAIARELGASARGMTSELADHKERLARTEQRIKSLIQLQLDGDRSEYLAETRCDLEAQARAEKATIEQLSSSLTTPVSLPTGEAIMAQGLRLQELVAADPLGGREALRGLFGGSLPLHPEEGAFVAKGDFFPLKILELQNDVGHGVNRGRRVGCAGAIRLLDNELFPAHRRAVRAFLGLRGGRLLASVEGRATALPRTAAPM